MTSGGTCRLPSMRRGGRLERRKASNNWGPGSVPPVGPRLGAAPRPRSEEATCPAPGVLRMHRRGQGVDLFSWGDPSREQASRSPIGTHRSSVKAPHSGRESKCGASHTGTRCCCSCCPGCCCSGRRSARCPRCCSMTRRCRRRWPVPPSGRLARLKLRVSSLRAVPLQPTSQQPADLHNQA